MRIVLLLFALMVPAYLLMCQRQTGPDPAEKGLPIYRNEVNKAKGVEAMLKQGVVNAVLLAPGHGAQADEADVESGGAELAVFHEADLPNGFGAV